MFHDPRYRRAALSFGSSILASAASVLQNLFLISLVLDSFGADGLGLWLTIYSLVAAFGFLDLGLGLGVVTLLPPLLASMQLAEAKRLLSSAFAAMIALSALILSVTLLFSELVPWPALLGLTSPNIEPQISSAVRALLTCLALNIPASLVLRIQFAQQRGYIASLWETASRVLSVVLAHLAFEIGTDIPTLIYLVLGTPVLMSVANGFNLYRQLTPELRPSLQSASRSSASVVMKTGSLFLALQVAAAVAFSSDNVIVAHLFGPAAVADFGTQRTLFVILNTAASLAVMPLWPAYAHAMSGGETQWIRKTLLFSVALTFTAAAFGAALIILFRDEIFFYWGIQEIRPDMPLMLGFAASTIVTAVGAALAIPLNAASVMKLQVLTAVCLAGLGIPIKILAAGEFGINAMGWGTALAYTTCSLIPTILYLRTRTNQLFYASGRTTEGLR